MAIEYRYVGDVALSGRRLSGVVVDYDDTAIIGGQFRERIERGALSLNDVVLNLSHDIKRPIARQGSNLDLIDKDNAKSKGTSEFWEYQGTKPVHFCLGKLHTYDFQFIDCINPLVTD